MHKSKNTEVVPHPYASAIYRKTARPPVKYLPNVDDVAERCRIDGGEKDVIALLPNIFSNGISEESLTRKMTREEADKHAGGAFVQVYRMLLGKDEAGRVHCRLCTVGANEGGWKKARDALRHLKRDHFGLGNGCQRWLVH
jgi:hypothetical protein